jgi:hypothetical protein
MEPGNNSSSAEKDYLRYQELREHLNEEMNKWAVYSEEVEMFLRNNS